MLTASCPAVEFADEVMRFVIIILENINLKEITALELQKRAKSANVEHPLRVKFGRWEHCYHERSEEVQYFSEFTHHLPSNNPVAIHEMGYEDKVGNHEGNGMEACQNLKKKIL